MFRVHRTLCHRGETMLAASAARLRINDWLFRTACLRRCFSLHYSQGRGSRCRRRFIVHQRSILRHDLSSLLFSCPLMSERFFAFVPCWSSSPLLPYYHWRTFFISGDTSGEGIPQVAQAYVSTADSLFPTVICALKFFSHNISVCLLQRKKRGLRGEEGIFGWVSVPCQSPFVTRTDCRCG